MVPSTRDRTLLPRTVFALKTDDEEVERLTVSFTAPRESLEGRGCAPEERSGLRKGHFRLEEEGPTPGRDNLEVTLEKCQRSAELNGVRGSQ